MAVKASWLEVSLSVFPEQVDAVAEVMGRFTQDGVVIEQVIEDNILSPSRSLANPIKVFGFLFMDATTEEQKMRLEESLWHLSQIQPLPVPAYKLIYDQDWMVPWKKQYQPIKVGKKLAILPSWADNVFPDRTPIHINPGMAFGTGTHPTTQLCLALMERMVKPGNNIFDIGCGSGILSIAAVKLGAERAYGVDISSSAIASSSENAELIQVQEKVEFFQGSAPEIIKAHLVIANILTPVILSLFDDGLSNLVEAGRFLILSGILTEQIAEVSSKAETFGMQSIEKLIIDDWAALCLRK